MKKNISSSEIGQRDTLSKILKEIDTNKPSKQSSRLSKEISSDYESISSSDNGEQQVPRLNSKTSLAPIKKSASTATPKRPSAPPPLPPRQINSSQGCTISPVSHLKSKCSFNKKYDAPVLPPAAITKSESFNCKRVPPPLPLHPPPPIPQTKIRIAPRAPSADLDKRFHFLPIPNLVDLPKSFNLPKERKYPSESNCKKYPIHN